jgi:sugar (pentulose or hexulose) kinase
MAAIPVIAIFDIGKTNKKFFLLNEEYQFVFEQSVQFDEITDDDGDACEDVTELSRWVQHTFKEALQLNQFNIKAINFSAYGASFVHIDKEGKPVTPLYNYLKAYPKKLQQQFYDTYGGEEKISVETASPVLGHLNSGMQLYWLKNVKPEFFDKIAYSLHLPQYISYLITGKYYTDITSIGCHTQLWNFNDNNYHHWVNKEKIIDKLPKSFSSNEVVDVFEIKAGIGLHDSSAALIPYLSVFNEPFILISTGTWCISLNPFNDEALTIDELQKDCLCYIEYKGNPVKASRLFAGHKHEEQVKRLAFHFTKPIDFYKQVAFDNSLLSVVELNSIEVTQTGLHTSAFAKKDLNEFFSYEEAYHQLVFDIIQQQKAATSLILGKKKVNRIFVDGGFGKNPIYMNLLSMAFPHIEVFAASVPQATSIGAALSIHQHWNTKAVPSAMVELKYYAS